MTTHDFDTVFRDVFPRLVSLGVLKTGRHDVARDLAQETMLRAHARWEEVGGYQSPAAWCRTVMVNLLTDHHRSRASEQRAIDRLGARPDVPSATPNLDLWHELLDPLPDRQRIVVTLYYGDDRSVAEIAVATGMSRAAVKKALFAARRTLRDRLGPDTDGGRHG